MNVYKVIISLLYLGSRSLEVYTKEIEFTGRLVIEYDLQNRTEQQHRKASDVKTTIQLRFKTIHPNGVLFYRQGADHDFLQLQLLHGTIQCKGTFRGDSFDIYPASRDNFDDNKWHNVSVVFIQKSKKIQVHVDSYKQTVLTSGNFQELTRKTPLYVGGHSNRQTNQINFTGCMTNVRFEGSDLLKDYFNPGGFNKCRDKEFFPVQFRSFQSFAKLTERNPLHQHMETFTASFTFRTFKRHGAIFSVDRISPKFRLRLRLRSGSLLCDEVTPGNTTLPRLGSNLNDGKWHRVYATLNGSTKRLDVSIDGKWKGLKNYSWPIAFTGTSQLNILLGKDGEEPGFEGCMNDLQINNHRFDFNEMNSHDTNLGKCKLENPCSRKNPCGVNEHCSPDGKQAICTCDTNFEGPECKESIYKTTCNMYMEQGLRTDALCRLSAGAGTSIYTAQCKIRANHSMFTIIVRNKGNKFKVGVEEDSVSADNFYSYIIDYVSYIEQIEDLTRDSEYCRQNLTFESLCDNSTHSYPTTLAYWKFKDGSTPQNGPPDSPSCSYLNGHGCTTCMFTLTNKAKLPVTSLWFHRKYSAVSSYTVHPLECWGRIEKPDEKIIVKDDERLWHVCENNAKPTSAPTTRTSEKTANHTASTHGGCNESATTTNGHCGNYSSTTIDPSLSRSPNLVTVPDQRDVLHGKKKDSSADDGLSTAVTALLSCSLVVAMLLTVKFGLPRCIVCIRAHNMKGEYIVSSAGENTRFARNTFVGRSGGQCVHDLNVKHGGKLGAPAEKNSYWV